MKKIYIGKNIRYLRKKNKLTQTQLSEKTNINNDSLICKWEKGNSRPGYEDVASIMEYFGIEGDMIFTDLEEKDQDEYIIKKFAILLKETGIADKNDNISKEKYYSLISFLNSAYKLIKD